MSAPEKSLVNPDFSDLFSTAYLHNKEKSITKTILAFIANWILLFSWMFGYVFIIINLFQLYYGYYTSFIILAIIIYTPYFIRLPRTPAFARFLMNGAYYFEGGCSWSLEKPPPQYVSKDNKIETPQMYCYHPHGVFTLGFAWNGGIRMSAASDTAISNQVRAKYIGGPGSHLTALPRHGMAASALIYAPLFRPLIVDLCGCVSPAKKESFLGFMRNKISFGMTPGGFYEISWFKKSVDCVYIKDKKGFIKYALQYGYEIFPAYTFGECETYYKVDSFSEETKKWMSYWHIPTSIFFYGEYWWCPFLPYSTGIGLHTIIATGIKCPQIDKPTQKDIDEYHEKYLNAVIGVYDRNKWRFGLENKKLEIY
eukprot:175519_1